MNDEEAIQLILQDLDQPLNNRQRADLETYLEGSERSRQFAELVRRIEKAIQQSRSVDQSGVTGPGLSDVARARLQRQLNRALIAHAHPGFSAQQPDNSDESLLSQFSEDRKVAESEGEYSSDGS